MGWNNFFVDVRRAESRIGYDGLLFAVLAAGASETYGLYRLKASTPPAFDYVAVLAWMVLVLALTMFFVRRMAERPVSAQGLFRFAVAWLLLLAPGGLGIGLAVPLFGRGTDQALGWLLAGLLLSVVAIALLPAWPVAVLFTGWRAGPVRVLRASRGSRWAIVGSSFVASAVSRSAPDLSKAITMAGLLLRAAFDLALTTFQLIWLPAVAVAAWRVAAANDRLLDVSVPAD